MKKIDKKLEAILKKIEKNSLIHSDEFTDFEKNKINIEQNRITLEIEQNIPKKYWNIKTDYTEFKNIMKKSIFISGNTGTGKTVLACSLGKKYINKKIKIMYENHVALTMKMQCSFRTKSNDFILDIVNDIARFPGVFILDDLGAGYITKFVKQMTYFLLNEREQHSLTTIITSNHTLSELDEKIDSRISSRIAGMCKIIKLTGEDRRLKRGG